MMPAVPESPLVPWLDRLIERSERWSGRISVGRAVALILCVGALLTGGALWAEHGLLQAQMAREASLAAKRIQTLLQDRLDHHAALLEQVAAMTASPDARGSEVPVWGSGAVRILPARAWTAQTLSDLLGIAPRAAHRLLHCMGSANADAVSVCADDTSSPSVPDEGWFLLRAMPHVPGAWVLMHLRDEGLWQLPQAHASWHWQVHVAEPLSHTEPAPMWLGQVSLMAGGRALPVWLEGRAQDLDGISLLQRHAAQWVTGVAGLLCTLGTLHVYLMLISTRRRAVSMAREMAEALQRTQRNNQTVMDTAPDAILITDGQGRISWCNQASVSIFGQTLAELLGRHIGGVLPALNGLTLEAWFQTHGIGNRVIAMETSGLRNEGTPFPVAVSASRNEREGEAGHTFIVRDTTDAKWAEQELVLRERALASTANGVMIVSMTLPKHPVIYVNAAFERITGYSAEDMIGRHGNWLQNDDVDQAGVHAMRQAVARGEACQVVVRNYRKSGAMFYSEMAISPVRQADGLVSHYVGVQTDITDRMAAEQVLKLRTERLYAVFELSPDGFVVLDRRGEISIVNPAFERMTGLLAADLVGQSQEVLEEELRLRCRPSVVQEALPTAAAERVGERLYLNTPCTRTLLRRVRQGGHDEEVVMYFRDITHEDEVDRMKSEFLSMAAHELRTPMASIFGFTELLLARPFDEARRKDMLTTIHRQTQVLIRLVNELLDLARIESRRGTDFKRELQSLQPIIEATLAGLLVQSDARQVQCVLPTEPIWMDVDREKLGQALTNVLSNAYKYSPNGGNIGLDLVWRQGEQGRECGVRVSDQGVGMKPEHLARVFERFFRAETSGNIPGTGLGMTIVREIIELHGGEVGIHSQWGQGTVVTLWLPVR